MSITGTTVGVTRNHTKPRSDAGRYECKMILCIATHDMLIGDMKLSQRAFFQDSYFVLQVLPSVSHIRTKPHKDAGQYECRMIFCIASHDKLVGDMKLSQPAFFQDLYFGCTTLQTHYTEHSHTPPDSGVNFQPLHTRTCRLLARRLEIYPQKTIFF